MNGMELSSLPRQVCLYQEEQVVSVVIVESFRGPS